MTHRRWALYDSTLHFHRWLVCIFPLTAHIAIESFLLKGCCLIYSTFRLHDIAFERDLTDSLLESLVHWRAYWIQLCLVNRIILSFLSAQNCITVISFGADALIHAKVALIGHLGISALLTSTQINRHS